MKFKNKYGNSIIKKIKQKNIHKISFYFIKKRSSLNMIFVRFFVNICYFSKNSV